jgi:hypothetical protein
MRTYWKMFYKRWELILIITAFLVFSYSAIDASFWSPWWLRTPLRFSGFLSSVLAFANLVRLSKSVWVNS